jgi:hypothetical protein
VKVNKRSRVTGRGQRLMEGDLFSFLIVEHSQVVGSRALV